MGNDKFAWGPSQIVITKGAPIQLEKEKRDLESKKREAEKAAALPLRFREGALPQQR